MATGVVVVDAVAVPPAVTSVLVAGSIVVASSAVVIFAATPGSVVPEIVEDIVVVAAAVVDTSVGTSILVTRAVVTGVVVMRTLPLVRDVSEKPEVAAGIVFTDAVVFVSSVVKLFVVMRAGTSCFVVVTLLVVHVPVVTPRSTDSEVITGVVFLDEVTSIVPLVVVTRPATDGSVVVVFVVTPGSAVLYIVSFVIVVAALL